MQTEGRERDGERERERKRERERSRGRCDNNYAIYGLYYINERLILLKYFYYAELKDGRVPQGVTKRIGYWKAEEFRKFSYPASEYVLGGLLPDCYYHAWIGIVRITEMIFNTGRNGWTADDSELITRLIKRHNIITEESEGLKSCVVTLHNLIHLPEDIANFSSLDNYWCYSFERAVKKYVERSSNCKNLLLLRLNAEENS